MRNDIVSGHSDIVSGRRDIVRGCCRATNDTVDEATIWLEVETVPFQPHHLSFEYLCGVSFAQRSIEFLSVCIVSVSLRGIVHAKIYRVP